MLPLTPMAGTWKRVSSERVGLVLLDSRFPRSDSISGWCRRLDAVRLEPELLGSLFFVSLNTTMEKEMATHSSALVWRIPGTGEPGGLPSMGSHSVGHDWSDLADLANTTKGETVRTKLCPYWEQAGPGDGASLGRRQCCWPRPPARIDLALGLKSNRVFLWAC